MADRADLSVGTELSGRPDLSDRTDVLATVLATVVVALAVAAVYRKGALHDVDSFVVGVVSVGVIAASFATGWDRVAVRAVVPLAALAAWWMASAAVHGTSVRFLPLGSSILAFAAAFLAVRSLAASGKAVVAAALLGLGALSAVVGLVAESVRSFPLAERAQDLWRVSTTLTYSNAAGLLFAMALLIGLGLDPRRRVIRLGVFLCAAGLIATLSRGALLAFVVSVPIVPRHLWRAWFAPLLAGAVAGAVAVATSQGNTNKPIVIVVMVLASLVAAGAVDRFFAHSEWRFTRRRVVLVIAALLVVGVAAGFALRGPIERRVNDDRVPEWSAAVAQFERSPLLGVGPDKPLVVVAATHSVTPFAQSEYLQVLSGTGILGEVLLVVSGLAVGSALSRRDPLAACGAAAVAVFAVAGAVDFVWHLPALALVAGSAAGLSTRPPHAPAVPLRDAVPAAPARDAVPAAPVMGREAGSWRPERTRPTPRG